MTLPTIEQAKQIWQEGIEYRKSGDGFTEKGLKEYTVHSTGVAEACRILAEYLKLNAEKAYICGLLHDVGKRIHERQRDRFHGREGYEYMLSLGYDEVARVCLTHSFPRKDFDYIGYDSYSTHWLDWAREELAKFEYDEYDRIVQFCDMLFEGDKKVKLEERTQGIISRYKLGPASAEYLVEGARQLREYFDKLCGCDIYSVVGIE